MRRCVHMTSRASLAANALRRNPRIVPGPAHARIVRRCGTGAARAGAVPPNEEDRLLKLHCHPLSTYTRRVRIALAEKRIPHETVLVDMTARAHRGPEYLALNPYGRVPTLEHDGFVLYESTAILGYLESIYPEPA